MLTAVLAAFFTLGLVGPSRPADAVPNPAFCNPANSGHQLTDEQGVVWICKCAKPVPEWEEVCAWVHKKSTANQRAENNFYVHRSTNSTALVSSIISHHVGGAGNFGQSDVHLFSSNGNRLNRPIGARVIVAYLAGSWQPCHDSNWVYSAGSESHADEREPANCNPHQYRAQAAGTYFSYTLNTWLKTGFVYTPSYCIPPGSCGV